MAKWQYISVFEKDRKKEMYDINVSDLQGTFPSPTS